MILKDHFFSKNEEDQKEISSQSEIYCSDVENGLRAWTRPVPFDHIPHPQ